MEKKIVTREDAIFAKKRAIKKLNKLFEGYINSNNDDLYKKSKNLSSWVLALTSYISFEDNFIPSKNVSYKRGDVVKVNLGFNVGSELGGVHYAVVLDKENKHTSNTITVLPLSSYKGSCYERDVYLEDDLFKQVYSKWKTLSKATNEAYDKLIKLLGFMSAGSEALSEVAATNDDKEQSVSFSQHEFLKEFSSQKESLEEKLRQLKNMENEIKLMKTGSVAKIEQITTVSKMRIWDPKKTGDVLYGVRLSPESMDSINNKIKQLYIF